MTCGPPCGATCVLRTDVKYTDAPLIKDVLISPMPPVTEVPEKLRKTRKECSYTAAERAILTKHKEAYLATTSHQERDQLLRGAVFIDMFNYWFDGDKVVMTEEEIVEKQKVRPNKISLHSSFQFVHRSFASGSETTGA